MKIFFLSFILIFHLMSSLSFASSLDRSGLKGPCRSTSDCSSDLICRAGWCLESDSTLREADEVCYNNDDCRSQDCQEKDGNEAKKCLVYPCKTSFPVETKYCRPTVKVPADNGVKVHSDNSLLCRSGQLKNRICRASPSFKGFSDALCAKDSDCFSERCQMAADGVQRCALGKGYLSCGWVGQKTCKFNTDCCSSNCSDGECKATINWGKLTFENSLTLVGRVCAAPGSIVDFTAQCCTQTSVGESKGKERCILDFSLKDRVFPCLDSSTCGSGFRCDLNINACVAEKSLAAPVRPKDGPKNLWEQFAPGSTK